MLFTEAQLNPTNALSILDEAVYLDESEALINPATVPVREMSRLGEGVTMVRFDDISALAENHGANYIDAMVAVAEASGVDPELMAVAVDEADIITDPDIVLELANVVVAPLSEDDEEYQFSEQTCWSLLEEEISDEDFIDILLNEGMTSKEIRNHTNDLFTKHSKRYGDQAEQKENEYFDIYNSNPTMFGKSKKDQMLNRRRLNRMIDDEMHQKTNRAREARKRLATYLAKKHGVEHDFKDGVLKYDNDKERYDNSFFDSKKNRIVRPLRGIAHRLTRGTSDTSPKPDSSGEVGSSTAPSATSNEATSKPDSTGNTGKKVLKPLAKGLRHTKTTKYNAIPNSDKVEVETHQKVMVPGKTGLTPLGKGLAAAGIVGASVAGYMAYKHYKNQPKSVIGKRIVALRSVYSKFMNKANSSNNPGIVAKLKKVAAKILQVIDKLLGYLQNKAG